MARQVYTTSNGMVWEYIKILDRIISNLNSIQNKDELHQNIALTILLSVLVVETFINLFFQVIVSKPPYNQHRQYIIDCLSKKPIKSLEYKINHWLNKVFHKNFDIKNGMGKQFMEIKELRNRLMHFSSFETVEIDGVKIDSLSVISFYETLEISNGINAANVAEDTILEMLKLSGLKDSKLTAQMLRWTGKLHL